MDDSFRDPTLPASRTARVVVLLSVAFGLARSLVAYAVEPPETTNAPTRAAALVLGVGSGFRSAASQDLKLASRGIDPSGKLQFLQKSPLNLKFSDTWSMFFSGSFILSGHMRADRTLLAFYNPYFNSALYTVWSCAADKPQIEDAWLSPSPANAATPYESKLVTNTTNDVPNPWVASNNLRRFQEWLEGTSPPFSEGRPSSGPSFTTRSNALRVVEQRLLTAQFNQAALERLSRHTSNSPWMSFHEAVRTGSKTVLQQLISTNMTGSADVLLTIPSNVRKGIKVGFPAVSRDRLLLFAWEPNTPAIVVVSEYRRRDNWRLDDAVLLALRKPEL